MPLTLVLGPANSAKAGEVLGAYSDAAPRGALLVVPTAIDAAHYARELASEGAVLGSVLTFAGLADEIARRTGYAERRLTALQRRRVVQRACGAQPPGYVVAAERLIAELERTLVTPQRFAQALGDEQASRLYQRYSAELRRLGRVDRELFAWRALDALRASPGLWGSEPVFFYGFDDLHPLELDAIETLARVAGAEVTVSLTYEGGRSALAARAEAVEELRPLAERLIELPAAAEYYAHEALHQLERGLFEDPGERLDPGEAVRLLEAGGERAEAELVAANVLALLRAGVPGEEIAVVYRSLDRVAAVLERVFAQYGIEVAVERELPFGHTQLGRGLLALARCALHDAPASELLDYLRTPGVLSRPELADRVEADIRRGGVRTATEARERSELALREIDGLRDATEPARELARQARRLMAAPHRAKAPLLDAAGALEARALAVLLRALDELEQLGERPRGAELLELLEELRVPTGSPVRPGAVQISEPLAIRARRFRAVFVCGLQEDEFPLGGAPEPFLSDERRIELARERGLRLRIGEDTLARERYLFYACVSRATEALVLSYRSSDEEGNLALPSPFIADVAELLDPGWSARRERRLLADVVWPEDQAPTERELRLSRTFAAGPAPVEPATPVLTELALRHARHTEVVSAGALECYGECPVKWLVERELQPQSLDPDPDPLVRGSFMHTVLENTLRRFGRAVSAETLPAALAVLDEVLAETDADAIGIGRPPAVRTAMLRSIAADLRRYLRHEAASGCAWPPAQLELKFGIDDEDGALPPLQLGDDQAPVFLRGVIDRVDVDPAGSGRAIVRDYKSGRASPQHQGANWRDERRMQVALYMLTVRRLLGLEPVAGLYQPLSGDELRARGVYLEGAPVGAGVVPTDARTPAELESELADAAALAVTLAAQLRTGELEATPETCSREGCRYPAICRVQ